MQAGRSKTRIGWGVCLFGGSETPGGRNIGKCPPALQTESAAGRHHQGSQAAFFLSEARREKAGQGSSCPEAESEKEPQGSRVVPRFPVAGVASAVRLIGAPPHSTDEASGIRLVSPHPGWCHGRISGSGSQVYRLRNGLCLYRGRAAVLSRKRVPERTEALPGVQSETAKRRIVRARKWTSGTGGNLGGVFTVWP